MSQTLKEVGAYISHSAAQLFLSLNPLGLVNTNAFLSLPRCSEFDCCFSSPCPASVQTRWRCDPPLPFRHQNISEVSHRCCAMRPGLPVAFQFTPKASDGVEVRTLVMTCQILPHQTGRTKHRPQTVATKSQTHCCGQLSLSASPQLRGPNHKKKRPGPEVCNVYGGIHILLAISSTLHASHTAAYVSST